MSDNVRLVAGAHLAVLAGAASAIALYAWFACLYLGSGVIAPHRPDALQLDLLILGLSGATAVAGIILAWRFAIVDGELRAVRIVLFSGLLLAIGAGLSIWAYAPELLGFQNIGLTEKGQLTWRLQESAGNWEEVLSDGYCYHYKLEEQRRGATIYIKVTRRDLARLYGVDLSAMDRIVLTVDDAGVVQEATLEVF